MVPVQSEYIPHAIIVFVFLFNCGLLIIINNVPGMR